MTWEMLKQTYADPGVVIGKQAHFHGFDPDGRTFTVVAMSGRNSEWLVGVRAAGSSHTEWFHADRFTYVMDLPTTTTVHDTEDATPPTHEWRVVAMHHSHVVLEGAWSSSPDDTRAIFEALRNLEVDYTVEVQRRDTTTLYGGPELFEVKK